MSNYENLKKAVSNMICEIEKLGWDPKETSLYLLDDHYGPLKNCQGPVRRSVFSDKMITLDQNLENCVRYSFNCPNHSEHDAGYFVSNISDLRDFLEILGDIVPASENIMLFAEMGYISGKWYINQTNGYIVIDATQLHPENCIIGPLKRSRPVTAWD